MQINVLFINNNNFLPFFIDITKLIQCRMFIRKKFLIGQHVLRFSLAQNTGIFFQCFYNNFTCIH